MSTGGRVRPELADDADAGRVGADVRGVSRRRLLLADVDEGRDDLCGNVSLAKPVKLKHLKRFLTPLYKTPWRARAPRAPTRSFSPLTPVDLTYLETRTAPRPARRTVRFHLWIQTL